MCQHSMPLAVDIVVKVLDYATVATAKGKSINPQIPSAAIVSHVKTEHYQECETSSKINRS